jgi:predicted Zn-dependent protease
VASKDIDGAERILKGGVAIAPRDNEAKLAYVEFLATERTLALAERTLQGFIAQDPSNYELQIGLATLQQRAGQTDAALATYRAVIAHGGDTVVGLQARDRGAALLVKQGRLDEAATLVDQVLRVSARDPDALTLRASIEMTQYDPSRAIADLRAVLREQPRSVRALGALAQAYLADGQRELAEESLRNTLELAPSDLPSRIALARLLSQTDRAADAAGLLEQAVREAPANLDAREALAHAYIAKGDLGAARKLAEDTKTVAPDRAMGWYLAGLTARLQKRAADAHNELEHALSLQPDAIGVLATLTRLEVEQGHAAAALERLTTFVGAHPQSAEASNMLGEVYLSTKDYARALATLSRTTRLDPRSWLAWKNLAQAQLGAGDEVQATGTFERGIADAGPHAELVANLAVLYERQGRTDDAIRILESLHERQPRLVLASNNLAMLLVTYRTDRASLDRARDLTSGFANSEDAALIDTAGWVHFKRGELELALPQLEKALARAPESNVVRYHLGMAELQAGQRDRARANLQRAIEGARFSGIDEARSALARLGARSG